MFEDEQVRAFFENCNCGRARGANGSFANVGDLDLASWHLDANDLEMPRGNCQCAAQEKSRTMTRLIHRPYGAAAHE